MAGRIPGRVLGRGRIGNPNQAISGKISAAQMASINLIPSSSSRDLKLRHQFAENANSRRLDRVIATLSEAPIKFINLPETFGATANKIVSAPLFAKEVVRDSDNRVVGPSSQYILSAFNNNNKPFTVGTASKWFAYFALLYSVMKAGVFNGPPDFVSVLDDVGDTAVGLVTSMANGQPTLHSNYFEGFGLSVFKCDPKVPTDIANQTCYSPGGTYYQKAAETPGFARLWGYAGGLTPGQKDALLGLILLGGVGAFAFANRERLQKLIQTRSAESLNDIATSAAKLTAITAGAAVFAFGVSRELAHPVAAWAMILAAIHSVATEYRSPIQRVEGSRDIPMKWALVFGALWVGGDAVYRSLADSAGLYQFTPQGYATIYGNWLKWDWVINFPLLAADMATEFFLMAPLWARSGGLVQNSVEVAVAAATRSIHNAQAGPGTVRRWLQDRVPELHAQMGPNGALYPDYLSVRGAMQAFTKEERAAVKAGIMPNGLISQGIGHTLTAGALGTLGYFGGSSLTSLLTQQSHHELADVLLTTLGLGATGLLGDAALRDGTGRRLYKSFASFFGHQFGPRGRGLFWAVYTAVGTTFTTGMGLTAQTIKGFSPDLNYVLNIVVRSLINPWVNRLHMGWRTAYWPEKALSKFEFFVPGFFLVYCGIEFGGENGQMNQSTQLLYQEAARDFALTSDPNEKAELLGKLTGYEALVREAQNNQGYGRADTLERAKRALVEIQEMKERYAVPNILDSE